jgi:hypothetical protein
MSLIPSSFSDGQLTITDDGGNSATLQLSQGDTSFDGLIPAGRAVTEIPSRGRIVGLRLGQRVLPTITINAVLSSLSDAFHRLAMGTTSGFVSTSADIGDARTVDGTFSFSYGAESRQITFDDAYLQAFNVSEGDPSTVSLTLAIAGPVYIDGVALIGSR